MEFLDDQTAAYERLHRERESTVRELQEGKAIAETFVRGKTIAERRGGLTLRDAERRIAAADESMRAALERVGRLVVEIARLDCEIALLEGEML